MIARFVDWGPTAILWVIVLVLLVIAIRITIADRRKHKAEQQAKQDHRETLNQMWKPPPSD